MRKYLLSLAGAFAMFTNAGLALEPTADLTPKEAVRLISLRSDVPQNSIEVSFIIEGTKDCCDGFKARHVRRVAAIHPVRNGASQPRRLVFYDLYWNESLGWFMWESREERTGEAVYIWSEYKGQIVN